MIRRGSADSTTSIAIKRDSRNTFYLPLEVDFLAVGQTVKALHKKSGEMKRAEIVDKVECKREDVDYEHEVAKVHYWGTKPAEDAWLKITEMRLIEQFTVDWEDVKTKLPIAQDPESRARRKEVFASWSTDGKTSLSLKELQVGVQDLLGSEVGDDVEELAKAVEYAHKVARNLAPANKKGKRKKGGAKRVDFREFHGFITAFRYYLELAEIFEHLDAKQEDDQKLSLREVRKGLLQLEEWGIDNAMLEKEFAGLDIWTPKWKFADFAKFCVEARWSKMNIGLDLDSSDDEVIAEEGKAVMLEAAKVSRETVRRNDVQELEKHRAEVMKVFKQFDTDGSNKISQQELASVLLQLDATMDEDAAKAIFAEADANKDGEIDVEEFLLWLFYKEEY